MLLYINGVGDIFNDLCLLLSLFADDLKLYTVYKLDASQNDLQFAIGRLTDCARLWQLYRLLGLYQNAPLSVFLISNGKFKKYLTSLILLMDVFIF